jgi:hypothetical protein
MGESDKKDPSWGMENGQNPSFRFLQRQESGAFPASEKGKRILEESCGLRFSSQNGIRLL